MAVAEIKCPQKEVLPRNLASQCRIGKIFPQERILQPQTNAMSLNSPIHVIHYSYKITIQMTKYLKEHQQNCKMNLRNQVQLNDHQVDTELKQPQQVSGCIWISF